MMPMHECRSLERSKTRKSERMTGLKKLLSQGKGLHGRESTLHTYVARLYPKECPTAKSVLLKVLSVLLFLYCLTLIYVESTLLFTQNYTPFYFVRPPSPSLRRSATPIASCSASSSRCCSR